MFDKIKSFFRIDDKPLSAKKVGFSYDENVILKNFNLNINNNSIVSVVGRSGEGKSTFLHLIAGILTKNEGKIRIKGFRKLAHEDIGFVPQEISLIPDMSLKENIILFGSLQGASKTSSLNSGKKLMKLLSLDVPLDRFPNSLSGGQKVRFNIILSLLHNPKVLILDEPFVALDYQNRKLLWHFLEYQRNRKKTIILTTHMLVEAEHHSNMIVLLHKGKVFAKGKLDDIQKKLDIAFLSEVKFPQLTKSNLSKIKNYCDLHNITIMDQFNNYLMFSIKNSGQRNYLFKFFDKLNTSYEELSFREPNLDELFLKVKEI